MNRLILLSSAIGIALVATAAVAQRDSLGEMVRERANPAVPFVPLQNRDAAEADRMGRIDAAGWLREAQERLRRNRPSEANELVERAETRLLTRSTPASLASTPADEPAVRHIALARGAILSRDRTAALMHIDRAVGSLGTTAGSNAVTTPIMGGGSAGVTRSPAVILVQGAGGGGTGGLSGSSPGSPGVGQLPSSPTSPPQGAVSPGVGTAGGVGAPPPGSSTPTPGGGATGTITGPTGVPGTGPQTTIPGNSTNR